MYTLLWIISRLNAAVLLPAFLLFETAMALLFPFPQGFLVGFLCNCGVGVVTIIVVNLVYRRFVRPRYRSINE